jgi:D-galactarolactone cycloisomerase
MKIDRIETYVLKAPLSGGDQFYSSQAPFGERASLLVKITTDSGVSGWGESGVSMPVDHLATYTHDVLARRLLGRNAEHTGPIGHELYAFSRDFGRKGASIDAMSGIDIALWDIRGKAAGQPIHALMGGAFRNEVRAYATGLYYTEEDLTDPAGAADRARALAASYLEQGFSAVKGKVGLLALPHDIRRMQAVREEVGPDFLLMTDANHAYNRHTARVMGEALQDLGYYWFEEPLVPEDIDGMVALRNALSIALAAGECEYSRYGMLDLLKAGAVDILQMDISAAGGLTEGQAALALATAYQTPMCLHVWGSGVAVAAALQMTAVIPPIPQTHNPQAPENAPLFEFDRTRNPLRDDLVQGGFPLANETLQIPQSPGLGIEIDEAALKQFTVAYRESR